jgi:dTDP-4-amino-4,6-dideoxygalactose transaminase
MKVAFNNLNAQWQIIKKNCLLGFESLFEKSNFILGEEVREFEEQFAKYVGCRYAVGVSSGTDALKLSAQSLSLPGKTCFIVPAYTYVATLMGIEQAYPNCKYILVDCDEYYQVDPHKVREIVVANRHLYDNMVLVPVHLYGYSCNMDDLMNLAKEYDCQVIEDASQAHGAKWRDQMVGSFGDVAAFSLYPGKNLGAAGDAGIVTTNSEQIYQKLLRLRNIGSLNKNEHEIRGGNHRLDTIQAIILKEKLNYIDRWNQMRRDVVSKYENKIVNNSIILPKTPPNCTPVHHVYPVRVEDRIKLSDHLTNNGVQWGMHYPTCIEEMPMYTHLSTPNKQSLYYGKHSVSLPIHPFITLEEIEYLCEVLNSYEE